MKEIVRQTKVIYTPLKIDGKRVGIMPVPILIALGSVLFVISCSKAVFSTHTVTKEAIYVPYEVRVRDTVIVTKTVESPLSKRIVRDFTKSISTSTPQVKTKSYGSKTIAINEIITDPRVLEFITHNEVLQRVYKISKTTGLKPSVLIAQKGLESAWGQSTFTKTTKCLGNIKCNKKECKKRNKKGLKHKQMGDIGPHCVQLYDDKPSDRFVRFATYQEGWNHYDQLINKRYMSAGKKTTASAQINKIKSLGYATDPAYSKKVIGIIQQNKLNKLDEYILKGYTITSMTGKYTYLEQ